MLKTTIAILCLTLPACAITPERVTIAAGVVIAAGIVASAGHTSRTTTGLQPVAGCPGESCR